MMVTASPDYGIFDTITNSFFGKLRCSLYFCLFCCCYFLYLLTYFNDLTLLLLNTTCPVLANSVDPDQLASSEAN